MYHGLENIKHSEEFFEALTKLKTKEEFRKFFRDVATLSEITVMSERLEVVKLLNKSIPYRKIVEQTGVSSATITRVAYWLNNGMGGYRLMLDRLGLKKEERNKK